ncbi:hypothetical protein [Falsiroseomonas sp. CW058]|uniref:hypothetical protein n=1 Tax=Falsiroseomonas sp. CW058 TaxID=3388664 RepID=UPI003D31D18D
MRGRNAAAACLVAFLLVPFAAAAQAPGRQQQKCAAYAAMWDEALARFGRQGLGPSFVDGHAAFLAAGCQGRRDVCPRSAAELELANAMTIAAMNARMASSFVPFICRD